MEVSYDTREMLMTLLLLALFVINYGSVNVNASISSNLATTSFAIIGFVAVFYKLVMERTVREDFIKMASNRWVNQMSGIHEKIKMVNDELTKVRTERSMDFGKLEKTSKSLFEDFDELSNLIGRYKLVSKISRGVGCSFLAAIFFTMNMINPTFGFYMPTTNILIQFNGMGFGFLMIGVWYALSLVLLWNEVLIASKLK